MTEQPQQAVPTIQPAPLQAQWSIVITDPPNKFVVLIINDASGQRVLFLAPDDAERIAAQITDAARQCRSGLIIPGGVLPPNGHKPGGSP